MIKKLNIFFIIIALTTPLFGTEKYFYEFNDSKNRKIVLTEEPLKVISLAPNITETIYYLGAESKLIARTDYCDYPKEVKDIKSVGTLTNPNIERIIELNPDIVLAGTHFNREILAVLEEAGLNVIILLEEKSFEGIYKNISKLGKILNREDTALELIADIKRRTEMVKNKISNVKRPKVYYVIGYGEYGEFTAGGDTFISDIIELAGGDNIAKDSKGWNYTLEKIVEKNPDIFICSKYNNIKQGIMASNGYKNIPAIINGQIFEIDNNIVDRHGPRIIDGLETIAKILHPDIFEVE